MINLSYDFHIHSCLSPCGDDDMTPQNIVAMASLKNLDSIAITDHNTCKNCGAVIEAAKEYGLTVISGMELTTSEEVHILCLFYSLEGALAFDEYVYDHALIIPNNVSIFGHQLILNSCDEFSAEWPHLLISGTDISLEGLWELVCGYDGIILPAHLDKASTSIISNLGFVPPDSKFTCAELRDLSNLTSLKASNPYLSRCHILCSSDAHTLGDINEPMHTLATKEKSIKSILDTLSKPKPL